MGIREDSVEWNGDLIAVMRDGIAVAWGRWREGRVADRTGVLAGKEEDDDAWEAIEIGVRREAELLIETTSREAYDARGVDVTQIDRMLALTPRERLEVLEVQRRSILHLLGDVPRD